MKRWEAIHVLSIRLIYRPETPRREAQGGELVGPFPRTAREVDPTRELRDGGGPGERRDHRRGHPGRHDVAPTLVPWPGRGHRAEKPERVFILREALGILV